MFRQKHFFSRFNTNDVGEAAAPSTPPEKKGHQPSPGNKEINSRRESFLQSLTSAQKATPPASTAPDCYTARVPSSPTQKKREAPEQLSGSDSDDPNKPAPFKSLIFNVHHWSLSQLENVAPGTATIVNLCV